MANELLDSVLYAWRKFTNPTLPSPGTEHEPSKEDIFAFGQLLQSEVDLAKSLGVASVKGFESEAAMNADLAHAAGTIALVDGGAAFRKVGASGTGSWAAFEHPAVTAAADAAAAAEDAEGFKDGAEAAAAGVRAPKGLDTSDMIAQWLFDEGAGDTVENVLDIGVHDIDLTVPTNPNVTRKATGLGLESGMVQTASLTGVAEVAVLIKTSYGGHIAGDPDTGGFLIDGGPGGSGSGILGTTVPTTEEIFVGNGWGVHEIVAETGVVNPGAGAREPVQGGWVLLFRKFASTFTGAISFGGKLSDTSSRLEACDIAWAGAWSTANTTDGRTAVYDAVGAWAAKRGIYLRGVDCPDQVDGVIQGGDSFAVGYSLISGLSAADQAVRYPNVNILPADSTAMWLKSEEMVLGLNQNVNLPTVNMGTEIGLGLAKRAAMAASLRGMWICKLGMGGSCLIPADGGVTPTGVPVGQSWNVAEPVYSLSSLLWRFVTHIYRWEQEARLRGVGINVKLFNFLIGPNDVIRPSSKVASANTYRDWVLEVYDAVMAATSLADVKMHMTRSHNHDPLYDATTGPRVRDGQDAAATARPAIIKSMNTDAIPLLSDQVHPTANGSKTIAADQYAWGGL